MSSLLKPAPIALAALLALAPLLSQAQTQDPKEALRAAVAGALRPMLGESAGPVVERLMTVKPDGAISRNFDVGKVTTALFGRSAANVAPDCRSTQTTAREPDAGLCVIDAGNRESETGAYTVLAFSKNIGAGDVLFSRRAAFTPGATTLPSAVKLSDAEAHSQALSFMSLLGVPRSEIPEPPKNAKNLLPVRSLVVGAEDKKGGTSVQIPLHKVVSFQRAFVVPGGLLQDPASGVVLHHVIAPGSATLAVSDRGVQFAQIEGWSDAQMDDKLDPRQAKSTSELVNEIADDLYGEGVRKVGSLSILIALRRAYPHPDDPNPPLCPVCGVLRPALKVIVSQAGAGAVSSSEKAFIAPGLVREYDLVSQANVEQPSR